MRCWTAIGLAAALWGLTGCASWRGPAASRWSSYDPECFLDRETVEVPMTHDHTRQWRVNAEVDGVAGVFVVDTGADYTVVTPQFARRLAVADAGEEDELVTRSFRGERVEFAKVTNFKLAGASYAGFYAPVVNLDHISQAAGTEVAGILGNNLLNKTAYEADWSRNLLRLESRSQNPPPDAIPIVVRDNRVYLEARVNGRPARFALDTGAYRSTLARGELGRLNIPPGKRSEIETQRIDFKGSARLKQIQAQLDTFKAGPISRTNYLMLTWDNSALGMDLLEPWVLRVDARRGWMSLSPD